MKAPYGIINSFNIWNSNSILTPELATLGYRLATKEEKEKYGK